MTYEELLAKVPHVALDSAVRVQLSNGDIVDVVDAEMEVDVEDLDDTDEEGNPHQAHRLVGLLLHVE